MKIIKREAQQNAFKFLVEIIKTLATIDSREATDAIIAAFKLAELLGVQEDLDRISGKEGTDYKEWTDLFCVKSAMENRRRVRREEQ